TLLAADPQDGATRLLDTLSLEEGGTYSEWTFSAAASIARSLPVKKRPAVKEHPAMRAILESARTTLTDSSAPVNLRRSAIELLAGWLGSERDREQLAASLVPQTPNELQEAVVDALARSGGESVPSMFLAGWS